MHPHSEARSDQYRNVITFFLFLKISIQHLSDKMGWKWKKIVSAYAIKYSYLAVKIFSLRRQH